nr:unnamed protein product [Callosobruchus analis]
MCDSTVNPSDNSILGNLEKIPAGMMINCVAVCNACNKTFVKYSNLLRHAKHYHPDNFSNIDRVHELTKLKKYNYECSDCKKHFTHSRHFKSHLKCHEDLSNNTMNGLNCILCQDNFESQFGKKSDLYEHLQSKHYLSIVTEVIHFDNKDEFDNWKKQEESKTNELFVNAHGRQIAKTSIKINYVCHIKLKEKEEVRYVSTHIGHKNYLGYLNLGIIKRQELAAKIALKIPFEAILDEVRESIYDGNLERSHLLTKKDLYNTERSFNARKETRHANDAISVDAWVEEMKKNECVLFYKPQGEPCEYPELKLDDFALIIMNQGQAEMFKKYGTDCICVGKTHGINAYHFNLTTILVLDEMREGFPCCFLISNGSDDIMMKIFFPHIKNYMG